MIGYSSGRVLEDPGTGPRERPAGQEQPVQNFQGENLGEVEDVILGLHQNMDYAVLSFGGFLDLGDKLFVIPLSVMIANTDEGALFFDIAEQDRENAPGFIDDAWPEVANVTWDDDAFTFWNTSAVAAAPGDTTEAATEVLMAAVTEPEPALRASELFTYRVVNPQGEDLGEIEDILIAIIAISERITPPRPELPRAGSNESR